MPYCGEYREKRYGTDYPFYTIECNECGKTLGYTTTSRLESWQTVLDYAYCEECFQELFTEIKEDE